MSESNDEVLVRIVNTQPRFLTLPTIPGNPPKTLLPGGNNVKRSYFEWLNSEAKPGAKKAVSAWFSTGILKLDNTPGATEQPEGPAAPDNLLDLPDAAAEAYVESEDQLDVLIRWRSAETRKAVKSQLDGRIQFLTAKAAGGLLED